MKKKIVGGVRKKPKVRMLNRKFLIYAGAGSLLAIIAVFAFDPLEMLRGVKPPSRTLEVVEPLNKRMDLEGLPTDPNPSQAPQAVSVASLTPPAPPSTPPDLSDLPKANGLPNGFPTPENTATTVQEKPKPKTTRRPLGFSGEDPYESIAGNAQQNQVDQNQTAQMVSMNQEQDSGEGQSQADKFRNQNRGSSEMFLGNQPISAKPKPGHGQITPGFRIPAKLTSATNSELGGSVTAKVSVDIYDEATGTCLMIDNENSKIFGKQSDQVNYGQSRQQVSWKSIHTPKMHLDIGGMDATDAAGSAGIDSKTNRHYGRLAIAAIGATILDVLPGLARGSNNSGTEVNIGSSAANNVASIGQRIIDRELNVKDELYQNISHDVSLMVDRVIELPCLNRR
jgi:type IV secretory pathway VirB10-like protein